MNYCTECEFNEIDPDVDESVEKCWDCSVGENVKLKVERTSHIDNDAMYMNLPTGTVQSGEDWKADQEHDGWHESQLKGLMEVTWDSTKQEWVKA
jgi:hypothetical protein